MAIKEKKLLSFIEHQIKTDSKYFRTKQIGDFSHHNFPKKMQVDLSSPIKKRSMGLGGGFKGERVHRGREIKSVGLREV